MPRPRMTQPRHDAHLRLDDELWERIENLARRLRSTQTTAVELALAAGLDLLVPPSGDAPAPGLQCPVCGKPLTGGPAAS